MHYYINHDSVPPKVKPLKPITVVRLIIVKGKSLRSKEVFVKESVMNTSQFFDYDWSKFLTKEDFIGKEFLLNQEYIAYKKSAPYTFFIMKYIENSFSSWQLFSRGTFQTKKWIKINAS